MKQYFKELFDYSHHFNQKLAGIFNESPDKTSDKAIKLYNHLLNAHQIWNNRIELKQKPIKVWDIRPSEQFKSIDQENYEHSLLLLEKCELTEIINYSSTSGEVFSNNIRDIYFHIINHSTYHRGQIATEFKQSGLTPLVTDYIFYKR